MNAARASLGVVLLAALGVLLVAPPARCQPALLPVGLDATRGYRTSLDAASAAQSLSSLVRVEKGQTRPVACWTGSRFQLSWRAPPQRVSTRCPALALQTMAQREALYGMWKAAYSRNYRSTSLEVGAAACCRRPLALYASSITAPSPTCAKLRVCISAN